MSPGSIAAAEKANLTSDQLVGRNTTTGRAIATIIGKARALWRNKTAAELAVRTGMSVRSAERWMAGDRSFSGDAIIRLLSSDEGVAFLEALVDGMPPSSQARWHREFERAARRADLRMRQDALQRELDQQHFDELHSSPHQ